MWTDAYHAFSEFVTKWNPVFLGLLIYFGYKWVVSKFADHTKDMDDKFKTHSEKIDVKFEALGKDISSIKESINELNTGKMWSDTCEERHKGIEGRLNRIENHLNGALKK